MTEIEELLRQTFADHERDLGGAAPSLAGVRERSRRRRRRQAVVLAGGLTVAAVVAGSMVALTVGPPRAATGNAPPPPAELPAYRTSEVSSADGRTSAEIRWAPTWLPAGIGETGRLAGADSQARLYGRPGYGPLVQLTLRAPVFSSPPTATDCGGTPSEADGAPAATVDVAGRPARVWSTRRVPTLDMWPGATATTAVPGHLVCVPLAGGGSLWSAVSGTADTAGDAVRVAGSVRPAGAPAEVAVPFSIETAAHAVGVVADDAGTGRWTGQVAAAGGTVVEVGRPDPASPPPDTTVGGRPAHVTSSPTKGTFVTMPLDSGLEARLVGEFRDTTVAAATGLRLGATPDYGWISR
jgi:hypothetical protein